MLLLAILGCVFYMSTFALNKIIFLTVRYIVKHGYYGFTLIAKELVKCHNHIPLRKHIQKSVSHWT